MSLRPSRTAGTDCGLPHGSGAHAKPRMKGGFERRGRGLPWQARRGRKGVHVCMLHVRLVAADVLLLAMRGPRPVWGGRLLLLVDAWHWPSAMMHVLMYTPGGPGRYALFEVSGDVESGRALGDGVEATAETSC